MTKSAADPREWAEDVMVVYKYLRNQIPEDESTPAREELHEWAKETVNNKKEFLTSMAPQASGILAKLTKPDDDADIQRMERRSIAELKEYLKNCLSESEKCQL